MPQEIERKFLVNKDLWEKVKKPKGILIQQGYLSANPECTIRVRRTDDTSTLTIKGINKGAVRAEFEYEIPTEDVEQLLKLFTEKRISKTRYPIEFSGKCWEVDVFHDTNDGLVVAEIELLSEHEPFEKPLWVTEEVTDDIRYYNVNLLEHPYVKWRVGF